jgi:hypothetical protein
MNALLDSEIRRAMAELADAAPVPHSANGAAMLRNTPAAQPLRRPVAITSAGLLVAASIAAFVALRPTNPGERRISPSTIAPATAAQPTAAPSTTATNPVLSTDLTVAPSAAMVLPEGWKIVEVSKTVRTRSKVTDQVFGSLNQSGEVERGFIVHIDETGGIDPKGADAVADQTSARVHESDAWLRKIGEFWAVTWLEKGTFTQAFSRGMTDTELLEALESLAPSARPLDGFAPSPAPEGMTALSTNALDRLIERTVIHVVTQKNTGVMEYFFGAPNQVSTPELLFFGEQGDSGLLLPWGGIENFTFSGSHGNFDIEEQGRVAAIVGELIRAATTTDLESLSNEASANLAQVSATRSQRLDGATMNVRGGNPDQPDALCLTVDKLESCALGKQQSPINSSHLASVEINGEWYLFGVEPDNQPEIVLVPWTVGMSPVIDSRTVIQRQVTKDGSFLWWYAKIPEGIDNVTTATTADTSVGSQQMVEAFRRWSS